MLYDTDEGNRECQNDVSTNRAASFQNETIFTVEGSKKENQSSKAMPNMKVQWNKVKRGIISSGYIGGKKKSVLVMHSRWAERLMNRLDSKATVTNAAKIVMWMVLISRNLSHGIKRGMKNSKHTSSQTVEKRFRNCTVWTTNWFRNATVLFCWIAGTCSKQYEKRTQFVGVNPHVWTETHIIKCKNSGKIFGDLP